MSEHFTSQPPPQNSNLFVKSTPDEQDPIFPHFNSTDDFIHQERPDLPVFLFRPQNLTSAGKYFVEHFDGDVFYAVKANPAPHVLTCLWASGIRGFDVASLNEVRLVRSLFPTAKLAFMHPIKNRSVIRQAYLNFGVRRFVLDSRDELTKIMEATDNARDLTLIARFAVSNFGSSLPLTGKFGIDQSGEDVPELLLACRQHARQFGISFHVGSQCLEPTAYREALRLISKRLHEAELHGGVDMVVDVVDVGGGFPSVYDHDTMDAPPALEEYMRCIQSSIHSIPMFSSSTLWCEPGRALCAESEGLVTRVEGVKTSSNGTYLYINDGSFGALYDSVHERWGYPVRALVQDALPCDSRELVAYQIYGPTCDSADKFPSVVTLPAGLREGDYLEWGNVGAYGRAMATRFNGFGEYETVQVSDSPWQSMYRRETSVGMSCKNKEMELHNMCTPLKVKVSELMSDTDHDSSDSDSSSGRSVSSSPCAASVVNELCLIDKMLIVA